ncbi:FAD-binding domain-containing protein [Heliocybe sulcata]|uniref:FAD-binding domain-containing protein n=1 Tax=Heliocybe sulcata TaxID=5364 RepID=A0A5C3NIG2_9AGAM|nr:FAD-binding domain-containing protein [Heliocybe sulcata]
MLPRLFQAFLVLSPPSALACKCTYQSLCWPNADVFASLATRLSQPLTYPRPPESACYPINDQSGDCAEIQAGSLNATWRADQIGSMQSINFETYIDTNRSVIEACYLNTTLGAPCEQGSVPVVGVDARTTQDVIEAVIFAGTNNLKVVIKNTGHDYLGRSTARGSFLIWTHNMKDITYDDDFSPSGAPPGDTYEAITLGAGVQWHEAYSAANEHNRILVGGLTHGGSVGAAGGWILGGGHSALSPSYGLGVDNVLQFTIVTSDGEHLTVSSYSHPDLFWALRGGGGGTFGVVTSVTYRTHLSVPAVAAVFSANTTNSSTMAKMLGEYARMSPALVDQGWGGYGTNSQGSFQFLHVAPNASLASANDSYASFFDFARSLSEDGLDVQAAYTQSYSTYYEWYQTWFSTGEPVGPGMNILLGSRLLPRVVVEVNYTHVGETLANLGIWTQWVLVAGGAVSKVDPEATGLNPAWRTALAELVTAVEWPEGSTIADINDQHTALTQKVSVLEGLAPGSGAYLNEASPDEDNWQWTFFGSHYDRLKEIKGRYDAAGMFVVAKGVGSEDWDKEQICPA